MATGFLYFMREVGEETPIKIGFSTNPPSRLHQYQIWSPRKLEIFLTVSAKSRDEYNAHCLCAESHSHHEWFHLSPYLAQCIRRLQAGEAADVVFFGTSRDHPIMCKSHNPRKRFTPAQRQGASYSSRLWRTRRRTGFDAPKALTKAFDEWASNDKPNGRMLPEHLQRRLDKYFENPDATGEPLPYKWAVELHGIESTAA